MGERTIPWCCPAFCRAFRRRFEREADGPHGFFVTCRKLRGGPLFIAVASAATKTITKDSDAAIKFCPWCGTQLAQRYADHLDVLAGAH